MSVAKRYTRALYETLKTGNGSADSMEKYRAELSQLALSIEGSKDGKFALYGPVVAAQDKIKIINQLSEKAGLSQLISNFVVFLARKNRLSLLPSVVEAFDAVVAEAEGAVLGDVVSADVLSAADTAALAESFERKLGKTVRFRVSTDPGLLAGVKVTVGGVTYDGSLKAQINRLKEVFVQGSSALN